MRITGKEPGAATLEPLRVRDARGVLAIDVETKLRAFDPYLDLVRSRARANDARSRKRNQLGLSAAFMLDDFVLRGLSGVDQKAIVPQLFLGRTVDNQAISGDGGDAIDITHCDADP